MNKIGVYLRRPSSFLCHNLYRPCNEIRFRCDKKASSDENSDDKKTVKKKEEALNKLNSLLKQMVEEDVLVKNDKKLELAKPRNKRSERKNETRKVKSVQTQMVEAVKDVASSIGGNTKQTESELLMKLLSPSEKSDENVNLSEVIKGMKIDRESQKPEVQDRAQQVRNLLNQRASQQTKFQPRQRVQRLREPLKTSPVTVTEKIDLFGAKPLGIFTSPMELQEGVQNETWNKLYKRDLKLSVTHPPSNYFQQMIQWTEEGKIWKFPLDNEQGLDQEKKVYFAEHIFLEKHLEPWCPKKGPIRHFMELVTVGLSKNPYMTVEAKRGHIEWYKNYFEEKKKLLQEVGAIPLETQKPKKLESKKE